MVRDTGRFARLSTFVLMAVAYATCEVASYPDGKPRFVGIIAGVGLFAVAVALTMFGPKPSAGRRIPWFLTHRLHDNFFVIATQNPVEHHGTYPLPEAQLDRFAMKLSIGYPDKRNEQAMLAAAVGQRDGRDGEAVQGLMPRVLLSLQDRVAAVAVSPAVQGYLIDLGHVTRSHPHVPLGLSPRGLLIWQRVSQAWAFLQGRPFVTPDDVRAVAGPVLGVRLGADAVAATVVPEVLASVPVPVYPN